MTFKVRRASGKAFGSGSGSFLSGLGAAQRRVPHGDGFTVRDDVPYGIEDGQGAAESLLGHPNVNDLDRWSKAAGPVFRVVYEASQSNTVECPSSTYLPIFSSDV